MVLGISFCQKLLSHAPTHQAALLSVKMDSVMSIAQKIEQFKSEADVFVDCREEHDIMNLLPQSG